jgi:peptidoglycan/LPS O-acetylase OafA/YrhL
MDDNNPYQTPAAALLAERTAIPQARLFKVSGIGLATFLGTLLAGGLLMGWNYGALGRPRQAPNTLLYSLAGFIVLMVAIFLLPESVPNVAFTIPQIAVMVQLAKHYQDPQIAALRAQGVVPRSNWLAAGVSLLVLLALLLLMLAVFLGLDLAGVPVLE